MSEYKISDASNDLNPDGVKRLFIGGLSATTESPDLHRYFARFGDVEEISVMTDRETGKSRAFGFLTFEFSESVEDVLHSAPHTIRSKQVVCKLAHPRGSAQAFEHHQKQRRRVYLGDLPHYVTEKDVRDLLTDRGFRSVEAVEIDR